jgi:uncharacterized protein (TIGR03086 family)
MAPLNRGLKLLDSAVSYALAGAALVTPRLLSRPTPCPAWDMELLLDHLSDSIAVVQEALSAARFSTRPATSHRQGSPDPVVRLRSTAATLLGDCAGSEAPERQVAVGDRQLTTTMVVVTGALEIAVHGWDISIGCGAGRPVPSGLAVVLLPIAPLLIAPGTRPGLFADPVRLPWPACPGDQLVAFLGRQPSRAGRPGSA